MKYFSTFSGIGGFELGIQLAYESLRNVDGSQVRGGKSDTQGDQGQRFQSKKREDTSTKERPASECTTDRSDKRPLCIGYSEIDKYATQIYQERFPEHKNYGDITKIVAEELPDFDLLVGGFPCQAFSIAGKRGGFEDTRGTMFFELARILRAKQPRLCVFENVKGLLSHDGGKSFATIIQTLDELGYDCQWQVLNSKNHGVPQNRERVFIVGHLRGTSRPEVFPFGEDKQEVTERGVYTGTLTSRYPASQREGTYIEENGYRVGTLRTHKDGNGFREVKSGLAPTIPARAREDGSGQPVMSDGLSIRRLTPVECERLQGFPDYWTTGISETQRYKCLGNAVTVNVIRDIFERIV